jgi:hypothetical protein
MGIRRKIILVAASFIGSLAFAFVIHEMNHFHRYGHLAPVRLHADVDFTIESNLLGIRGVANVYNARLTNYSVLPITLSVCDYINWAGAHDTVVDFVVERWDTQSNTWKGVPEWDNSRLFCRPAFEVVETHLIRRRLWPGQGLRVGGVMPAERGGFHQGDYGRFTIFLGAAHFSNSVTSTAGFRIDRSTEK